MPSDPGQAPAYPGSTARFELRLPREHPDNAAEVAGRYGSPLGAFAIACAAAPGLVSAYLIRDQESATATRFSPSV